MTASIVPVVDLLIESAWEHHRAVAVDHPYRDALENAIWLLEDKVAADEPHAMVVQIVVSLIAATTEAVA